MKTLIDTNSPLYKKRLVRELNSMFDGFYAYTKMRGEGDTFNIRCNRARIAHGIIQVKSGGTWYEPCNQIFSDAYGRDICSSRKA